MLDDPAQSRAAGRLIDSLTPEAPGFLSLIVLAELAWVLDVSYHFDKEDLVRVLEALLQSKELIVEGAEVVTQALGLYAGGKADFADYLVERSAYTVGCAHTVTFDRRAAASAGMRLLK